LRGHWEDFVEVFELFDNAAAREVNLGNEAWQGRERVPRKEVFIGWMSRGISDLPLCRIREIRGYSGGFGNYSQDNQGIVWVI